MVWLPGLQALALGTVLFLRATAAAGSTNGGHWVGLLLGGPVTEPLDTLPPPVLLRPSWGGHCGCQGHSFPGDGIQLPDVGGKGG